MVCGVTKNQTLMIRTDKSMTASHKESDTDRPVSLMLA